MLRSMWLFPLAAAVIAAVFAGLLARQFLARKKPYQLLWAIALLMYAGGSFALFLGVVDGWSAGEYRAFWLLGAVLNVPYLALGEVYLLVRNRAVGSVLLLVLLFATAFAFNRVRTAGVDVTALGRDLPLGRDVFVRDPFALHLAQLYAYPTYAFLVLGTLWSAWKMRGAPHLRDRFLGTLGIAGGATIAAAGSAFAATGILAGFSLTIAVAIAVMFWGFLRASRPPAPAPASSAPGA
jgi:hypothetical protein